MEPLPENFMPPEAWPEFVPQAQPRSFCERELLQGAPRGIRWGRWPLYFEEYVGDEEPALANKDTGVLCYPRAVMWKRVRRFDTPKGWMRLSRLPWRIDGYQPLERDAEHAARWHKQARRELRLWEERRAQGYRIAPITLEQYAQGYAQSTVGRRIGLDPYRVIERKWHDPIGRPHMELWGAYDPWGRVVAGICLRFSPTTQSATYESPFMLPEAKEAHAATALIDHWMRRAREQGMRLAVFNSFWQPGEPKSWKAFSLFKSHFGPTYTHYPPTLWKFVWGKIL